MTPYDAWRTNVDEANEEAWEDAVEEVAFRLIESGKDYASDTVNTVALADDVLTWLSHAVEVPQHHLHTFRDLCTLAANLRKQVETEMKANRAIPMKIDWSIMLDELIYVGGAMAMAVMALGLIGIGYLWIGGA